jgi:hypothetical protein
MSVVNFTHGDTWIVFVVKFRKENTEFALRLDGKADFASPDGKFSTEINRCLGSSEQKDNLKVIEMCVAFLEKLKIFSDHAAMRPVVQVWAGDSILSEIEKDFIRRDLGCFLDRSIVIPEVIKELDISSMGFEEKINGVIQEVNAGKRWADKNVSAIINHMECLKNLCKIINEWHKKFLKVDERLCNIIKKCPSNIYETLLVGKDLENELLRLVDHEIDVLSGVGARNCIEDFVVKPLIAAVNLLRGLGRLKFDVKAQLKEMKKRVADIKWIKSMSSPGVDVNRLYCCALGGGKYDEVFNGLEALTK